MSRARQLRQMQEEINHLQRENEELKKQLAEYRKRDKPMAGDFLKRGQIG